MKYTKLPGLLIALEGIDGSGKSTLAHNLYHALMMQGHTCTLTKQPGGTVLGGHIRQLLQYRTYPMNALAEYLLFAADRAQHMQEVVLPALAKNHIVISDRLGDSSLVYQGYGRNLDRDMIRSVNAWAMQQRTPDVIVYLHLNAHDARTRVSLRRKPQTAFEKESDDFVQRIIDGFETVYEKQENVIKLDATQSPEQLTQESVTALKPWILRQILI